MEQEACCNFPKSTQEKREDRRQEDTQRAEVYEIDLRPKADVLARSVVPVASKYHAFYDAVINYMALLCHLPDSRSEILAASSLAFPWRTHCQNTLKEWRLRILVWPLRKERNLPTLQRIYMRHVCCNKNKSPKPSQRILLASAALYYPYICTASFTVYFHTNWEIICNQKEPTFSTQKSSNTLGSNA